MLYTKNAVRFHTSTNVYESLKQHFGNCLYISTSAEGTGSRGGRGEGVCEVGGEGHFGGEGSEEGERERAMKGGGRDYEEAKEREGESDEGGKMRGKERY